MGSQIFWILKLNIRDGKEDDLKKLMSDMVAATKTNEPGAMRYQWFISDDESECHIHELYKNDAAVLEHLSNFSDKFAERFMDILEPFGFEVYGNPGKEVQSALEDLNPIYKAASGGFVR